jgi:Fe-S-cluster containining protein
MKEGAVFTYWRLFFRQKTGQMKFNCTGCGVCCMNLGRVIAYIKTIESRPLNPAEKLFLKFPYNLNPDGSCEKYNPGKGCSVYSKRPLVCNVGEMEETMRKHFNWGEKEYYDRQASSCNTMMFFAETPPEFIIPYGKERI